MLRTQTDPQRPQLSSVHRIGRQHQADRQASGPAAQLDYDHPRVRIKGEQPTRPEGVPVTQGQPPIPALIQLYSLYRPDSPPQGVSFDRPEGAEADESRQDGARPPRYRHHENDGQSPSMQP